MHLRISFFYMFISCSCAYTHMGSEYAIGLMWSLRTTWGGGSWESWGAKLSFSFYRVHRSQGLNSGHGAWWQVSLPAEPSHRPIIIFFMKEDGCLILPVLVNPCKTQFLKRWVSTPLGVGQLNLQKKFSIVECFRRYNGKTLTEDQTCKELECS